MVFNPDIPIPEPEPSILNQTVFELVFEGLDTFAEINLNGLLLGKTDNSFRTWRFNLG